VAFFAENPIALHMGVLQVRMKSVFLEHHHFEDRVPQNPAVAWM
jgi:hypothetical protein